MASDGKAAAAQTLKDIKWCESKDEIKESINQLETKRTEYNPFIFFAKIDDNAVKRIATLGMGTNCGFYFCFNIHMCADCTNHKCTECEAVDAIPEGGYEGAPIVEHLVECILRLGYKLVKREYEHILHHVVKAAFPDKNLHPAMLLPFDLNAKPSPIEVVSVTMSLN